MIPKNDFVMINWGNLVQKDPNILLDYEEAHLLEMVDKLDKVYEKIKSVAPESKIVQPNVVPFPGS